MSSGECKLLSGLFSILVQGSLLVICLAVLLVKRWRERPRRAWLIWCFDLSKQAFSSGLQHFANLLFGVLLASDGNASQCGWYFVLYVITSSAAIFVVAGAMVVVNWLVARYELNLLRTGDYGNPPSWRPWIAQLLVWGAIGLAEKVLTTFVLVVPFRNALGSLAGWIERPLLGSPRVELVLVMVVTPVLLNVVSVVVFDNIMKRKTRSGQLSACETGSGPPHRSAASSLDRGSDASLHDPLITTSEEAAKGGECPHPARPAINTSGGEGPSDHTS